MLYYLSLIHISQRFCRSGASFSFCAGGELPRFDFVVSVPWLHPLFYKKLDFGRRDFSSHRQPAAGTGGEKAQRSF